MVRAALSKLVQDQISKPSLIREIMKMADPKNLTRMGLDPGQVISFAGGWVNHSAPEALRQKYIEICSSKDLFHKCGGYSATPGEAKCRSLLSRFDRDIFGVRGVEAENVVIGQSSSQLTRDLLSTLLDPGSPILLLDPTYANYFGQLTFAIPSSGSEGEAGGVKISYLNVFDPKSWSYMSDPDDVVERLKEVSNRHKPGLILFPSPDNPTSKIVPEAFVRALLEIASSEGTWVVIDYAYKTLLFDDRPPAYFSWGPADYENLILLYSNSKWGRGLGRRMGWIVADQSVVEAMERTQQTSILCPDTLHQMALAMFLEETLEDGSLREYLDKTRKAYEEAARVTVKAIDKHLGLRRADPEGGLYTVADVGRPSGDFVADVMKKTGVLMVPGYGFGPSLAEGVRVSYGPLVDDLEKIDEGMERVGSYLQTH